MSMAHEENRAGPEPMEIEVNEVSKSSAALPGIIPSSDVMVLEGHASEVFVCAWSPSGPVLASGAEDSTARIWTIGDRPYSSNMQTGPLSSAVLKHFKGRTNEKNKDVTTLDWNEEGTLLATGSYDGQAKIWNRDVGPKVDASLLAKTAACQVEKKKSSTEAPVALAPRLTKRVVIREPGAGSTNPDRSLVKIAPDRERKNVKVDADPPSLKRARIEPDSAKIWYPNWDIQKGDWYPNWDIQKGDYLFGPN